MSAKIGAIFRPHERQAPIIRPATEGGDCEAGRLAGKGKSGGRRYVWVTAAEARSFCTEDPAGRVVPATGEYRVPPGEEGEGPRHPASARKSQHNYPAKALRAVGGGVAESARRNPWPRPSNYHHRPPLKQQKEGLSTPPWQQPKPHGGTCGGEHEENWAPATKCFECRRCRRRV